LAAHSFDVLLVCLRPEPAEPAQVKIRIKVQINGAWNFSHSAVDHKYIISSPRNHCRNIAGGVLCVDKVDWTGAAG